MAPTVHPAFIRGRTDAEAPPEPSQSPGDADSDSRDEPRCDVCPHAVSRHDAIGLRFCHATLTGAVARGCICRS